MARFLRGVRRSVLVLVFGAAAAQANTPTQLSQLAFETGWLKLGHYEPDASSATGWRSAIHSGDFFLDASGNIDPLLELQSTLAAFVAPPVADPDQHAQCRFPARWLWLKARLGEHPAFRTPIKCPAFESWTRAGNVSSLSIVFATGYLANPASYYGHTLLKFNFSGNHGETGLLDVSVNYGAILEKNDDLLTYIIKSVFGGYDGGFSHIHFYFHNHNYGDNELRDMWEFKLDLPQDAVDLIVAHAWEVLGKRYSYRFFRHNCAYRMAEIVQIIDGLEIIPKNKPWIIPQALIQGLAIAEYQGRPVLAEVAYHPSRQSRFYEKYRSLSQAEARLLKDLVVGKYTLQDKRFEDLSILSKQKLLDALLDYYQFVGNPLEKASKEIRQGYVNALSARFHLEAGSPEVKALEPRSPHLGRPIGWLQAAWGNNTVTGDVLSIRFRPAYYDALDADSGHVRNSALIMGDTQLNIRQRRVYISKVDLIGVESARPGLSGLPGDNGTAWKLHVGAEQQRLYCDDCLVARVQGDIGYGRQWPENLFSAAYVGVVLQSDRADQGVGYTRISTNLILRQSDRFGVKLDFEYRFPFAGNLESYGVADMQARWSLNSRTDFRINYERDDAESVSVGIGWYW